ncbi:hypothetical protein ECO2947_13620 [Escherichia coli]|nr:hypothetical protein ECO2947_13620 [Escherichia coli]
MLGNMNVFMVRTGNNFIFWVSGTAYFSHKWDD